MLPNLANLRFEDKLNTNTITFLYPDGGSKRAKNNGQPVKSLFGKEKFESVRDDLKKATGMGAIWRQRLIDFLKNKSAYYTKESLELVEKQEEERQRIKTILAPLKPFVGTDDNPKDLTRDNLFDLTRDEYEEFLNFGKQSAVYASISRKATERRRALSEPGWAQKQLKPLIDSIDALIREVGENSTLMQQLAVLVLGFVNDESLKVIDQSFLNMVITGAAGVGKTRLAKTVATFLGRLGILVYDKPIKVARADLIGQYVGQTAPRVNALFYQNLERVIFLDEAYSITTYDQKGQLDSRHHFWPRL